MLVSRPFAPGVYCISPSPIHRKAVHRDERKDGGPLRDCTLQSRFRQSTWRRRGPLERTGGKRESSPNGNMRIRVPQYRGHNRGFTVAVSSRVHARTSDANRANVTGPNAVSYRSDNVNSTSLHTRMVQ